ncbi:MAG: DUF2891 domain-containing protein [Alphaproteobacteria bacterium]|nr:DUF2891 domain-containing protein [Alphaproteobacteria bacterium]MDE2492442.1 DUF2891 domain-containing protein [Alphaproteobacteria bacterium]
MSENRLTAALADRFAAIALGHVTREFPNKLDHVLNEPGDARTPRDLHPIFYGSFDWHSCVHGYWMMARLRRLFPDMAKAGDIAKLFDDVFVVEKVAGELVYLSRPLGAGFERPYGWAWLLMLAAELRRDDTARRWSAALRPLEEAFVARFTAFLPKLSYAIRAGTHFNTAFALILAADYADVAGDAGLLHLLAECAQEWFGQDRGAVAWEPSGDDFLSPTLTEAVCMQRLLSAAQFSGWFAAFLPDLARGEPKALFEPAFVSDRSDGKIAHLDGLNLSRAWCMRALTESVQGDPREAVLHAAAEKHLRVALPHVAGDYMGEHWLATYAVLALESEQG